jgi:hypothetical protein
MSEQNINKKALELAEQELLNQRIEEIKGYMTKTLQGIESKKKEKEKIEEELRVLKLDLEDLRNGKFDKIEERIQKSPIARNLSLRIYGGLARPFSVMPQLPFIGDWTNLTSGTFNVNGKIFYL